MKKQDNILRKMWDRVTIEKWQKFLRLVIICMVFMVVSEGIFEIPVVKDFFGAGLIEGKSGWIVYAIVWLVMFAQVAIIPIPALPILTACNQIQNFVASGSGLVDLFSMKTLGFVLLVTSATTAGAIASYWLGRTFGKPAIRWIAGSDSDYKVWVKKLNSKTGRWIYASTVLLPIFPDDLISLVVGSIKMNFSFYVIVNVICKAIGLYTMLIFMRMPGIDILFGNNDPSSIPWALLLYSGILIISIIGKIYVNRKIDLSQPKNIKLEEAKNKVINYLTKRKSSFKELIVDQKLNKKLKTYLASEIQIKTLYQTNAENKKSKIRIFIICKASNYWQVIFDKTYKLTESYQTLIDDFKNTGI